MKPLLFVFFIIALLGLPFSDIPPQSVALSQPLPPVPEVKGQRSEVWAVSAGGAGAGQAGGSYGRRQ